MLRDSRALLAQLPTTLPRQAELFFLLFPLWISDAEDQRCYILACPRTTRGELSACLYVSSTQPLHVTLGRLALLYLKLRKGSAGEKG